jgi:hypothetical protein
MPSLVTTGVNQKNQNKMMIFLDNEECMDNDNISFSDDSYDAEVEPEVEQGGRTRKSAYLMKGKWNETQQKSPTTSCACKWRGNIRIGRLGWRGT